MEADTDEIYTATLTVEKTKGMAMPPRSMSIPLPSSQSSLCSTPLLDEVENNLLKQQHTLHTFDSGFSDWTPDSATSLASLSKTPSLSHGASLSAQSTTSVDSEFESDSTESSLHHRRSWPMRSRKLSFHSPDTDGNTMSSSPMFHVHLDQADQNADSACHSNSTHSEEELRFIISKSSIAKHSPIGLFLERSRSLSRSPLSSSSDDLENSFQEMSLEENSSSSSNSSSNQPSPKSFSSSSPIFSFSLQHKPNEKINPERDVSVQRSSSQSHETFSNCNYFDGGKKCNKTNTHLPFSQTSELSCVDESQGNELLCVDKTSSIPSQTFSQVNISGVRLSTGADSCEDICKVDFVSNLSLIPLVDSTKLITQVPSSSSPSPVVFHNYEQTLSTNSSLSISSSTLPFPNASSSTSSQLPCQCLTYHPCNSPAVSGSNFVRSPTKRCCIVAQRNISESVSPQKMRKLRARGKSSGACNIKRDLFGQQSLSKEQEDDLKTDESRLAQPQAIARSPEERTPQFLHIDNNAPNNEDSSIAKTLVTPVSRWRNSNSKPKNIKNVKIKERSMTEADDELISRICLKFSPSIPSQLIGRHIGVKQFDILGELHRHNLIGCIEIILAYIPDSDLLKITEVSNVWKSSLSAEQKAYRRYKTLCKKMNSARKIRNLTEKENVVDKLQERENVLMTSSKGHLTAIQPQSVAADTSTSTPLSAAQLPEFLSEDRTRNCPHCQCRAVVVPCQDRATCVSEKCAYDFCIKCLFPFHHPTPCKPLFHCASKTMLAGSKKSKRNLKRLKNL